MTWTEICEDKSLENLSYKIETNRFGNIVMSPASNFHGYLQIEIASILKQQKTEGKVLAECSVDTNEGVKVADVAWFNDAFHQQFQYDTPFPIAPQLCVEVISPSNKETEMNLKKHLYFSQGAQEVWYCDLSGDLTFHTPTGNIKTSTLFPNFPEKVDL